MAVWYRVPTAQRKQGKWHRKFPVRENIGNLEILSTHRENTGNLVCSSCKFPDSKGKRYLNICHENFQYFLSWTSLPSQFRVCDSHRSRILAKRKCVVRQRINRKNTGNLKMQFEWVPCGSMMVLVPTCQPLETKHVTIQTCFRSKNDPGCRYGVTPPTLTHCLSLGKKFCITLFSWAPLNKYKRKWFSPTCHGKDGCCHNNI